MQLNWGKRCFPRLYEFMKFLAQECIESHMDLMNIVYYCESVKEKSTDYWEVTFGKQKKDERNDCRMHA